MKMKRLSPNEYENLDHKQKLNYTRRCFSPKGNMKNRTPEELAEGCIFFINMFCFLFDKDTGGAIPFKLWAAQEDYIRDIFLHKRVISNKTRQSGITWVNIAVQVWKMMFMDGQFCGILSIGESEAKETLARAKFIMDKLPSFIMPNKEDFDKNTESHMRFKDKRLQDGTILVGSQIMSTSTKNDSYRGKALTDIFWDEAAFPNEKTDPSKLYTTLKPIINNGYFIINSTPNGMGNLFYELFTKAEQGENSFWAINFHWAFDPRKCKKHFDYFDKKRRLYREKGIPYYPRMEDDDYKLLLEEEWYIQESKDMTPEQWEQENELSFLNSGDPVFDPKFIVRNYKQDVETATFRKELGGDCLIFEEPKEKVSYVATLDPAEGKKRDYTVLHIFEVSTMTQVVEYASNKLHIEDFLFNAIELLHRYNNPTLIFERKNAIGGATNVWLDRYNYYNVYEDENGEPGFDTNPQSKQMIISLLRSMLYKKEIKIKSKKLYDEILKYSNINGKLTAPPGYHDDRVMSLAFLPVVLDDLYNLVPSGVSMFI